MTHLNRDVLNCLDTGDEHYMSRLRTIVTTSKGLEFRKPPFC
jgi:hypothetical protein